MHRRQRRTRKPRRPAAKNDEPPDDRTPEQIKKDQDAARDAENARRQKEIDDAKAEASAEAAKKLRETWGLDPEASDDEVKEIIAEHKKTKEAKQTEAERTANAIKAAERAASQHKSAAEREKAAREKAEKERDTFKLLASHGVTGEDNFDVVSYMLEKAEKKDAKKSRQEHIADLKKEYPSFFTGSAKANTTVGGDGASGTGGASGNETKVDTSKGDEAETITFLGKNGQAIPKVDLFKMSKDDRAAWLKKNKNAILT